VGVRVRQPTKPNFFAIWSSDHCNVRIATGVNALHDVQLPANSRDDIFQFTPLCSMIKVRMFSICATTTVTTQKNTEVLCHLNSHTLKFIFYSRPAMSRVKTTPSSVPNAILGPTGETAKAVSDIPVS
jgi:hypothetical protein